MHLRHAARLTTLVVLLVIAVAASARPCLACSCVERTPEQIVGAADSVFQGHVLDIEGNEGRGMRRVTFAVSTIWKGPVVTEVVVEQDGSTCSVGFREGMSYLVLGTRAGAETYTTSICNGTSFITAGQVNRILGPGTSPPPTAEPAVAPRSDEQSDEWSTLRIASVLIVLAAIIVTGVYLLRRRWSAGSASRTR